jgi:hypothetical protein
MTDTPIGILQKADSLGLALRFTPPDTLDVKASGPWPKSFADTLRTYKPQLLDLLRLPFVMVFSQILEETVFFCADEPTKAALVAAGAEEWSIYTKEELRTLCEQNGVAPLTATELKQLHQIRRTFNARITPNDFKAASISFPMRCPSVACGMASRRQSGMQSATRS